MSSNNTNPEGNWDLFLAHAEADKGYARELYNLLKPSCRVFLDEYSIPTGAEWDKAIARAQRLSRATVILLSPKWEDAYYLREEIAVGIGLSREIGDSHAVIPVYLEGFASMKIHLPYGLQLLKGLDAKEIGLRAVADRLIEFLKAGLEAGEAPGVLPAGQTAHPLHAYPRGPLVSSHLISKGLIDVYASVIDPSKAASVVDEAIAYRVEADPYDPELTIIKHSHLPPPATVPPVVYWRAVFTEARLHGPRMLAALILVVRDTYFPKDIKEARQLLLEQLASMR